MCLIQTEDSHQLSVIEVKSWPRQDLSKRSIKTIESVLKRIESVQDSKVPLTVMCRYDHGIIPNIVLQDSVLLNY